MKLLQILELLTLIAEKVAFWKQAEKKAEADANSAKKASLGTIAKEDAHDQ